MCSSDLVVLVANSDGHLAADVRPLVRINVSVIVEQDGRREQGYAGAGGRITLPELVADDKPIALAREAVRQALVNLDAVPAPAGLMTVVLGPGWPGILLHEAIGHGLEGDFNRKGTSAFAGRVGSKRATPEPLYRDSIITSCVPSGDGTGSTTSSPSVRVTWRAPLPSRCMVQASYWPERVE